MCWALYGGQYKTRLFTLEGLNMVDVWDSALKAKAYQENTLDIGLDTFPSLVSISQVRECVTKTIQKPLSSGDALSRVNSDV